MSSINKVILVGNLGADPEIRRMQSGAAMANLRVATTDSWRDKSSGERREKTEWHRVVIFSEPLAKIAEEHLRKGAKIYLEGSLQTRKWQKDGQDHYSTEVVLSQFGSTLKILDKKGNREERSDDDAEKSIYLSGARARTDDDEIPF